MRIPRAVELYEESLPLVFPGLTIGNDLSNRSFDGTVSASSSWTIWYDQDTGENRRSSAADGYLWADDQQRDSLIVLTNHKVDRILFSGSLTANSVIFGTKPRTDVPGSQSGLHIVHATKEIILAAGSLSSAAVLERSGIGRSEVLEAAGVQQLVDIPGVGVNVVDQPGTGTSALVAEASQNDTSLIDGRILFAPEISLLNVEQIWGAGECAMLCCQIVIWPCADLVFIRKQRYLRSAQLARRPRDSSTELSRCRWSCYIARG